MDRYAYNEALHLASKEQWRTIAVGIVVSI